MRRPTATAALLTMGALVLAACGGSGPAESNGGKRFPMTVPSCDHQVTLEKRPQRVMTIGVEAPTLMAAAGAGDAIVARSTEAHFDLGRYEHALPNLPDRSPIDEPSTETIIAQRPDLVIHYGLTDTDPEQLAAAGINSLTVSSLCNGGGSGDSGDNANGQVNLTDVYHDIRLYGRIFGTQQQATASIAKLRQRVADVKTTGGNQNHTAAAVYTQGSGILAYGRANMSHTQIKALGMRDVFADLNRRYTEINAGTLLNRDPDVLIVAYGGAEGTKFSTQQAKAALRNAAPGITRSTAFTHGQVIPIHVNYILGSPLAVDGLEKLAKKLNTTG